MNSLTHKIVGVTTVAAIAAIEGPLYAEVLTVPVYSALMLLTAPAGSILADADMATTEAGRKLPWVSKFFTHRGATHTPVMTAIPLVICLLLLSYFTIGWPIIIVNSLLMGFFIGYASHVIIDTFNYNGCPIFWPIYKKNIYIFRISTANSFDSSLKGQIKNTQETAFKMVWVAGLLLHVLLVLGGKTL